MSNENAAEKNNVETNNNSTNNNSNDIISEEFLKVVKDFYKDVLLVFPEFKDKLRQIDIEFLTGQNDGVELFKYCSDVYPKRFFDILYENEEMFADASMNTMFLPNIEFKQIWKEDISDNTRKTIWKYLQLILFSVSSGLKSSESFGDAAKLFEAINEDELKNKLQQTMEQMGDLFKDISMNDIFKDLSGADFTSDSSGINMEDMPNPEDLQDHINGLLDGKLGRLAHEIAKETAEEMQVDMDESADVNDVFQKLFKNPGKLLGMVKNVGQKLDEKLKSGEIKETELMQEASELMEKMKSMPGMKNMNQILSKMGLPVGGKNSKVSMNAFQSHMKKNMRKASQRERMLKKLEERKKVREQMMKEKAAREAQKQTNKENTTQYTHTVFRGSNEKIEKTTRKEVDKKANKKKRRKRRKNKK